MKILIKLLTLIAAILLCISCTKDNDNGGDGADDRFVFDRIQENEFEFGYSSSYAEFTLYSANFDAAGNAIGPAVKLVIACYTEDFTLTTLTDGKYRLGRTNSTQGRTFVRGYASGGVSSGTYMVQYDGSGSFSSTYFDGGSFTVKNLDNGKVRITIDLLTEDNEIFKAVVEDWAFVGDMLDNDIAVDDMIYAYAETYEDNDIDCGIWLISLHEKHTGESNDIYLEVHTPKGSSTLPTGNYSMADEIFTYVAGKAEPGYYINQSRQIGELGCSYGFHDGDSYVKSVLAAPGRGSVNISETDGIYTINAVIFDREGHKITGSFTGELDGPQSSAQSYSRAATKIRNAADLRRL